MAEKRPKHTTEVKNGSAIKYDDDNETHVSKEFLNELMISLKWFPKTREVVHQNLNIDNLNKLWIFFIDELPLLLDVSNKVQ